MSEPEDHHDIDARFTDVAQASRIYFLPNFFTAGNMLFGFLAIIRCIQAKYVAVDALACRDFFNQGVLFIFLACICDLLDGRVARLGGRESLFGIEFDSMADLVSFGMAPALMVFFHILSPTDDYPFFRQIGWFIGFIYLLCAAIRLARFNVITSPLLNPGDNKAGSGDFKGMPVPPAAGVIASLVLIMNRHDLDKFAFILPVLMLLVAYLMISTIPFPSFKRVGWQTKMALPTFIGAVMLGVLVLFYPEYALAVVFWGYMIGGLIRGLRKQRKERHRTSPRANLAEKK